MCWKLLLACVILSSCTGGRMIETNLYFGQSKPDGGRITEEEWRSFRENRIAPVFKEGSTVINAMGNWYDPVNRKLITEPTYIVVYFHKNSPQLSKQIDSIRYWYKIMFQQQSILRVDKKVTTDF
jgi:hypothetical protein